MLVMLATVVLSVESMRYGNIDATWGLVDEGPADPTPNPKYTDGATCLMYSDGPDGLKLDPNNFTGSTINLSDTGPNIQNDNTTNWNQVRYGRPDGYSFCGGVNDLDQFQLQSGLAFNGVNERTPKPDVGMLVPFSLGKMCHINNPIRASNTFEMTYADLSIHGVDCGSGGTLVKNQAGDPFDPPSVPVPTSINLDYRFMVAFEETPNSGTCKYVTDPPGPDCADAVTPGQAQGQPFYCKYEAADGTTNVVKFTVAFVGFTQIGLNESCENATYDPSQEMPGIFISNEGATNCACVWAAITNTQPTAVDMNYFEAEGGFESIILRWQTAFETDNIGFNVYRAESLDCGQAVQLNNELIKSLVPPGSTFGADYEFIDTSAQPYRTYFYWIEDIDVNGEVTVHGPVRAEWVDQQA